MTLLIDDLTQHEGKALSHFEGEHGNKLSHVNMETALFIVFTDGSKIRIETDWYGAECYISQFSLN